MTKLLAAYRANPSLANARKVRAYGRKHPFARTLLSVEDAKLAIDALFHASSAEDAAEELAGIRSVADRI